MKVKFMSSGTWVASGMFEFQVIARQAVLAPSMGIKPALRASTETASSESFLLPLGLQFTGRHLKSLWEKFP